MRGAQYSAGGVKRGSQVIIFIWLLVSGKIISRGKSSKNTIIKQRSNILQVLILLLRPGSEGNGNVCLWYLGSLLSICFESCCFWILQEWRCSKFTNLPPYCAFWVILRKLARSCPYSWSPFIPYFFAFALHLTTLEALVWRARMIRREPHLHNQDKTGNFNVLQKDLMVR